MQTKLSKLIAAMDADDWPGALRIAAKFQRLGMEKVAITRAHDAYLRPDFYRQLGKDPCALLDAGKGRSLAARGAMHSGALIINYGRQ